MKYPQLNLKKKDNDDAVLTINEDTACSIVPVPSSVTSLRFNVMHEGIRVGFIEPRTGHEFKDKALYLDDYHVDYVMGKDSNNQLVLVAIKKETE